MRNRLLVVAVLLLAPAALGACGSDGEGTDGETGAPTSPEPAVVQVKELCRQSGATSVKVYRRLPLVSYGELGVVADDATYRGPAREVACARLEAVGRLDESGVPPDDLPYGAKPWLRVRSTNGPALAGWIASAGANARLERAIDRLPAATPAPAHPSRRPDLTFGPTRTSVEPGDPCANPGEVEPVAILADVKNVGKGTVRSKAIEVRAQGSVSTLHFNRGLEPGEKYPRQYLFPGEHAVVDPRNKIRESNEGNNTLEVGSSPVLTCGPG